MSNEAVVQQDLQQVVRDAPAKELRHRASDRFRDLVNSVDPRKVTEQSMTLLFRDWESARSTEEKARKMLEDAIAWKELATSNIVATLGAGEFRYKGVLYTPKVVGKRIALRPLKAKKIP